MRTVVDRQQPLQRKPELIEATGFAQTTIHAGVTASPIIAAPDIRRNGENRQPADALAVLFLAAHDSGEFQTTHPRPVQIRYRR